MELYQKNEKCQLVVD